MCSLMLKSDLRSFSFANILCLMLCKKGVGRMCTMCVNCVDVFLSLKYIHCTYTTACLLRCARTMFEQEHFKLYFMY